jgi:F0F1-type ATP synthase assembly protein I
VETPGDQKNRQLHSKLLGTGFEFGGTIAVFCYIGYRLDEKWHTSPYCLLGGFFLSFIAMLYLLFKETKDMRRK